MSFLEEKAKKATSARCLRFIPAGEFLTEITPPDWVIDGIAETDSLTVLFGDPEAGKSFMAMDWAACVATGTPWKDKDVRQGPVLYLNGEGQKGVNRRFTAWSITHDVDLRGSPLYLSSMTTALTDEMGRTELEAVVSEFMREQGPPALIVVDTLSRNFGSGDENSTQDMRKAVETLDAIRALTRAWIVVVHHTGHADKGRGRGSMVLPGAADTSYRMSRTQDVTLLECMKIKDGQRPPPMGFRFANVELGVFDAHGHEVTSAVLLQTQHLPKPPAAVTGKNQRAALAMLRELWEQYDQSPVLLDVWRTRFNEAGNKRRQTFYEAKDALVSAGQIKVEGAYVRLLDVSG